MTETKEKPTAATVDNSEKRGTQENVTTTETKSKAPLNQVEAVLRFMQTHDTISSYEAFELFGVTRLSAIIYKLKHRGHNIASCTKTKKNRYGQWSTYSKYYLVDGGGVKNG